MDINGYLTEIHVENNTLFVHATNWMSQKALDDAKFVMIDDDGNVVEDVPKPTKEEWEAFKKDLKENFWSENYTYTPKYQMARREKSGDITLPIADIERIELKAANPMVNGRLTVFTKSERKIILHFRRKSAKEFAALAEILMPVQDKS